LTEGRFLFKQLLVRRKNWRAKSLEHSGKSHQIKQCYFLHCGIDAGAIDA